MRKFKQSIIDFFKGIGIGIAAMIPGVSGGTFAILTNCYDKIINSINTLFKTFKKSILVLLPIILGVGVGLICSLFALDWAFRKILFTIVSIFAGLILGSIPNLSKEIASEKTNANRVTVFIIAFLVVIGLAIGSVLLDMKGFTVQSLFDDPKWYLYIILIPIGILASSALVMPGISGSMVLLVLGFYHPVVDTIISLLHFGDSFVNDALIVGSIAVGIIVGFFLISKLMGYLLANKRVVTFYGILGFIFGSLPALYINMDIWNGNEDYVGLLNQKWEIPVGIVLLIVCAFATYIITKKINSKEGKENA